MVTVAGARAASSPAFDGRLSKAELRDCATHGAWCGRLEMCLLLALAVLFCLRSVLHAKGGQVMQINLSPILVFIFELKTIRTLVLTTYYSSDDLFSWTGWTRDY